MRDTSDLLKAGAPASDAVAGPAPADAGASVPHAALASLLAEVGKAPYAHDLFALLRAIDAICPASPRLGESFHPADEALRMAHDFSLSFAPAALGALVRDQADAAPRLGQRVFGLTGPNGPLPLHLTEYVRDRLRHAGDASLARFLDVLMHRFLLLFYRAWAQGRPVVSLDRAEDRFGRYVGALIGIGEGALRHRDAAADPADHLKLHFGGLLQMQTRPADALVAVLAGLLGVPVSLQPYTGHWMTLAASERTCLGAPPPWRAAAGATNRLGAGAILGASVWDRQSRFRLRLGPLTLAQYRAFLPGGRELTRLAAVVRFVTNEEFAWDVHLVLRRQEVPRTVLGRFGRLGYTSWLGPWRQARDADSLTLDAGAQHVCTPADAGR